MKNKQDQTGLTIPSTSLVTDNLEKTIKDIFEKIGTISQPNFTMKKIKSDDAIICLQREYVFFYREESKYIGTKNLHQCIGLYFYNDLYSFFAHCDITFLNQENFFIEQLELLANTKVYLMILGGYDCESSKLILKNIIKQLIAATNKLHITFRITHQKTLQFNEFKDEDKPLFIYNKLVEKMNYLYSYLFNKRLDTDKIMDFSDDIFSKNHKNNGFVLTIMPVLMHSSAFMATETEVNNLIKDIEIQFNLELTENNFYTIINSLFCKLAFDLVEKIYTLNNSINSSSLTNFVIDTKTLAITKIPYYFPTPHEILRDLVTINPSETYTPYLHKPKISEYTLKICFDQIKENSIQKEKQTIVRKLDKSKFKVGGRLISGSMFQFGATILFSIQYLFFANQGKTVKDRNGNLFLFFIITNTVNIIYVKKLSNLIAGKTFLFKEAEDKIKLWLPYTWLKSLSSDSLNELAFGQGFNEGAGISRLSLELAKNH